MNVKMCFASGYLSSCVTLHQFPSRLVAFSQHFEPLEQVINAPFHTVFPCKTCNFQAGEEQTFQGALKSPYALAWFAVCFVFTAASNVQVLGKSNIFKLWFWRTYRLEIWHILKQFLPPAIQPACPELQQYPAFCKLLILTTFVVSSCAAICKLANNSHCQDWATRWRHLPWGPFGTFRWATTVCSGRRSSWRALNGFGSELISADFKALIDAKLFIFVYSKICLFPSPSWILGIATFKLWHWLI